MECPVCCDKFNKSTRKPVECNYCKYIACRQCNQCYILGSINEPKCMSCKIPWNKEFLWEKFTHKFYNTELEEHRGNILFEREKTHLPETQHRLYCQSLRAEVGPLEDMVIFYEGTVNKPSYYPSVVKRVQEIREIIGTRRGNTSEDKKKVVYSVLRGCPNTECKGFIMKKNHQCGLCNIKICSKCHIIQTEDEHVCKTEDIETAKLLMNNTKPCPTCREMIYKIDGCDQMWCTMCHTAFSWKTGEIEENIHNPHYYEWMRRNGKAIPRADVPFNPCNNNIPDIQRIMRVHTASGDHRNFLLTIHRLVGHIRYYELPRLQRNVGNADNLKETYRVNYLQNRITEEEWKNSLISLEKKEEKSNTLREIFEIFNRVAIEQINNICATQVMDIETYNTFRETIEGIRNYCNEAFMNIRIKYNMVPYVISDTWGVRRL